MYSRDLFRKLSLCYYTNIAHNFFAVQYFWKTPIKHVHGAYTRLNGFLDTFPIKNFVKRFEIKSLY